MAKIKIEVTQEARIEAEEYAKKISQTETLKNVNYTNLNVNRRYVIGYLGEWVFNQYLKQQNITASWNPLADGKPNQGNFKINGLVGDVKTASSPHYELLMIPEAQLKHLRDFYVGVRLDLQNDSADICGWIDREILQQSETKDFGHGVPTKSCSLNELHPIDTLWQQ